MINELPRRITSICAVSQAYKFAVRNFRQLARLSLAPIGAIAVVQYISLRAYLSELMAFISSGDPRAASVALGALSAGLFISVFIFSVSASAVANLALSSRCEPGWLHFAARRQEWRIYAAYLRFLLLVGGFLAALYLCATIALPLLDWPPSTIGEISALVALAGVVYLFVRIGFLIPAIVACSRGTVLRRALHAGAHDVPRNISIVLLLFLPGLGVEILGESLLRLGSGPARIRVDLSVTSYAQALGHRLPEFVILSSISVMVVVILLTAASVICYRDQVFDDHAVAQADTPVTNLDSAPV